MGGTEEGSNMNTSIINPALHITLTSLRWQYTNTVIVQKIRTLKIFHQKSLKIVQGQEFRDHNPN